ncbi:MAG: prepilin-type N-terminal cleavage/methylation domain-containing protein [Lachnospiraceae bacterium]|nr:prepilin-type N-terminal cleavage/methylation domain-containing protein [Lachnospiraceae bacterium]
MQSKSYTVIHNKGEKFIVHDYRGFSLVELIIVISIMAVLTGIIAPQFLKYVENSRVEKDVATLKTIYDSLQYEYVLGNYTPGYLFTHYFGGTTNTNHNIDMNTKGEPILEVDTKGYAKLTQRSNFESGEYLYDALAAAGLDVNTLKSGGKIKLFSSKAMSKAISGSSSNGYKHLMMTADENDVVRVWIGSRSENDGKHTLVSLPDIRFAFGTMIYQ